MEKSKQIIMAAIAIHKRTPARRRSNVIRLMERECRKPSVDPVFPAMLFYLRRTEIPQSLYDNG